MSVILCRNPRCSSLDDKVDVDNGEGFGQHLPDSGDPGGGIRLVDGVSCEGFSQLMVEERQV